MRKNLLVLFLFMGLLVFVPIFSLLISNQSQDVRSRAFEKKILPALPLLSPFIRVGLSKDRVGKGELFPVYITAKSNEQSVVEAYIVLSYDPAKFILEEKNIINDNVFPTMSILSLQPGRVIISLFGNTQTGFEPVLLSEEKRLATLFFSVIGNSGATHFHLIRDGEEKTSLYAARDEDTGLAPDVLSSTQDAIIEIR